eukprot:15473605-Alexandrium_andersonii.AAC.1
MEGLATDLVLQAAEKPGVSAPVPPWASPLYKAAVTKKDLMKGDTATLEGARATPAVVADEDLN